MIDIKGACYRFVGDLLHTFAAPPNSSVPLDRREAPVQTYNAVHFDDLAARALTTVFGMDAKGRIKKEKALGVVEKLGLIGRDECEFGFELLGDKEEEELQAEEIMGPDEGEGDELRRIELIRQAFMVFDKDGDGFIEAMEIKSVLECLGLANGWDLGEFERMIEVVDLNFDGKVDFTEFQLMMGGK